MFSCGRYCSMLKDIFATNQVYMINLGVIRVTLSAKKKKLLSLISSKINYIVHAIMYHDTNFLMRFLCSLPVESSHSQGISPLTGGNNITKCPQYSGVGYRQVNTETPNPSIRCPYVEDNVTNAFIPHLFSSFA